MTLLTTSLQTVLQEQFGHDEFRPGQEAIIRQLLAGHDVLAIMPTAAGKSLLYQLTAALLPGVTIVVTPLLALMQDQVVALSERGPAVGAISSAQSAGELADELEGARQGATKLLYVTPERFENDEFLTVLRALNVSLFVVDEAHCLSEWGHSFRPAYLSLGEVIERLDHPPVLALTATGTPWVRRDIVERLRLRQPRIIVQAVDRPNLFLEVVRVEHEQEDRRQLQRLLTSPPPAVEVDPLGAALAATMRGSGIIYTATTAKARETARWLTAWGIAADYYHGQRAQRDRERVQATFMDGTLRVIAATNAFGLGIDKPDIRFVVHRDIPASLEAYYQEAGRAGRDGELARCLLIYRPSDLGTAAFLAGGGRLTADEVQQGWAALLAHGGGTVRELAAATGLGQADLNQLVELLSAAGAIARRRGRLRLLQPDFDPLRLSLEHEERRRIYERSRVTMMRGYAETDECRRVYLLNYFGETTPRERCGACDNDRAQTRRGRVAVSRAAAVPAATAMSNLTSGDRVQHPSWGEGVVQRVSADTVTVIFDSVGYKTLALALVQERDLLRPIA